MMFDEAKRAPRGLLVVTGVCDARQHLHTSGSLLCLDVGTLVEPERGVGGEWTLREMLGLHTGSWYIVAHLRSPGLASSVSWWVPLRCLECL